MKRLKRRLSQTLRGSHTIDESLSELAEQMTVEENGLKDSGRGTSDHASNTHRCSSRRGTPHAGLASVPPWRCRWELAMQHGVSSQLIFTLCREHQQMLAPAWLPWCPGSGTFQEFP